MRERIRPYQASIRARIRFNMWKIFHPRSYAKMKRLITNLDEMHEYTGAKVLPLRRM